ncbi:hypothetical protein CLOP_g893 [Closterium sp. NIES-67]|nr:hypothetical protein CLOP_g893 [Closterium sp. NIES-67]
MIVDDFDQPNDAYLSRAPEDVIISRNGAVLGKKTVLKSDHFPGCQNKRLLPHIDGAPNFRQIADLPVYGVAIPTVEGIRNVLQIVGASRNGGRHVLWHSMREEPVIYINGRPFVLREVERPFTNLEYTGINRARVEQMEARLKKDVLREAARYSNKIMVSDELPDGQMVDQWEPIGPDSVQTPLEVYQDLQRAGYNVDYERVPVTDEKVPEEQDFDLLVESLSGVDESTAQIFNCQMGRGRTTTGTVVATLICLARRFPSRILSPSAGASMLAKAASTAGHEPGGAAKLLLGTPGKAHGSAGGAAEGAAAAGAGGAGGAGAAAAVEAAEVQAEVDRVLLAGQYAVIRSLTRVLEAGSESKRLTDLAIDHCAAMQNLREAILGYRNRIHRHSDEKRRQAALSLFVAYLERYYMLLCFSAFLHSLTSPAASTPSSITSQALPSPSVSHSKADDAPSHVRVQETPSKERFSLLDGLAATQALREAKGGFQRWMKARPELYSILRRLLRRDPMGALGYAHPTQAAMPRVLSLSHLPLPPSGSAVSPSAHGPARPPIAPAASGAAAVAAAGAAAGEAGGEEAVGRSGEGMEVEAGDVAGEAFRMAEMAAAIVEARSGAMLSKQTVLKSDHCPGCQNLSLPELLEGAPNFRQVVGFPVYGVANPTVDGIRAVLRRVAQGGGAGARDGVGTGGVGREGVEGAGGERRVVWHNMREEATVYVNGKPFVLREAERPFKNMLEYTGIERQRVERMEARLKGDVLREAQRSGGMVVVDHESDAGELFHALEPVQGSAQGCSVQTPLEVFRMLQEEGFRVDYHRLPTTDGQPPKSRDFDALATTISSAGPHAAFVFNCQMGRGRTTTGTVIAALVLLRCLYGRPLRLPSLPPLSLALPSGSHPCTSQSSPPRCSPHGASSSTSSGEEGGSDSSSSDSNSSGSIGKASDGDANGGDSSDGMNPDLAGAVVGIEERSPAQSQGVSSRQDKSFNMQKCSNRRRKRRDLGDAEAGEGGGSREGGPRREGKRRGGGRGGQEGEGGGHGRGQGQRQGQRQGRSADEFELEDIPVVRKVTRMLDGGAAARRALDGVVDRCAQMLNIREAILSYRRAFNMQDADARTRQSALSRGAEFLERYVMLIAFAAYLSSPFFRPAAPSLWPPSSSPSPSALSLPPSSSHSALPRLCPAPLAETSKTVSSAAAAASGEAAGSEAGEGGAEREKGEGAEEGQKEAEKVEGKGVREGGGEGEGEGCGADVAVSFKKWLKQRPEIRQMKWGLRLRPARLFTIPEVGVRLWDSDASAAGSVDEREAEDAVLRARRGSVLGRGSILKLSLFPGLQPSALNYSIQIPHVPNYFEAPGYPVHSMATPTVQGAQAVLSHLGAVPQPLPPAAANGGGGGGGQQASSESTQKTAQEAGRRGGSRGGEGGGGGGSSVWEGSRGVEVVIVDLREEAVVYIHGKPFVLRDVDQPAASLKHVGIAGSAVEAMEGRLKEDILREAARCGGMVLLHKERPREGHAGTQGQAEGGGQVEAGREGLVDAGREGVEMGGTVAGGEEAAAGAGESGENGSGGGGSLAAVASAGAAGGSAAAAAAAAAAGAELTAGSTASHVPASGAPIAVGPTEIIGVWRAVGLDDVKTPAEVYRELREQQGYAVDYHRIPLTRERVPVASDVDALQHYIQHRPPNVKFLFVSHTGYGAIAYAMALTCLHLQATAPRSTTGHSPTVQSATRQPAATQSAARHSPSHPPPASTTAAAAATPAVAPSGSGGAGSMGGTRAALQRGEYRNVLQLERVLVKGPQSKRLVDDVAHRLLAVGRIVEDVVEYRRAADAVEGEDTVDRDRRAALTEMGLKALRRYCYLIAFRSYLFFRASASSAASSSKGKAADEAGGKGGAAGLSGELFGSWVAQRPEIEHMLQNLVLE